VGAGRRDRPERLTQVARRPFRFGIQLSNLPVERWAERAREIEALGFSTLFVPDHFSAALWDPTTMLGGVAAVTKTLNVGTLVYGVDFRHPLVYARQAATLQVMSGGRHEFGIGAGWMVDDYRWAGLRYDKPSVRIERLDEALAIVKSMWSHKKTTFVGSHFNVSEAPLKIAMRTSPKILIGGGGRKLLSVAGRHADIVGINPTIPEGRITAATALDITPASVRRKVEWVYAAATAAGRDPAAIELSALLFAAVITDAPAPIREMVAATTGMPVDRVADCPLFLVGSGAQVRDELQARREATGVSYVVIQGQEPAQVEQFAKEVVEPLTGA